MKTIFFSDLHKDIETLEKLLNKEEGVFYSLGDSELSKVILDSYNIISVCGNCDINEFEDNLIIKLDEFNVLLTHGHNFNVKFTLNNLYYYTKSINCDVVLFGHTHKITQINDDVIMLNPGSLKQSKSYIVYENKEFKIKYL